MRSLTGEGGVGLISFPIVELHDFRLLFAQRKEEETRRQAEKNQRRELLELKRREYIEKTKEILRMPEV